MEQCVKDTVSEESRKREWLCKYQEIDWEKQWAEHAQNYSNGYLHLDFKQYNRSAPSIRLLAGGGFGDLSHPTTRQTLKFVAKMVGYETVVDIGCGSGILTLAAAALGAKKCYGIDIDPVALAHSEKNGRLNNISGKCHFFKPEDFTISFPPPPILIVMNMIRTEQLTAWSSLPSLHRVEAICITSGIRKDERGIYLQQTAQWGWKLIEESEEEEWMAFIFLKS